MRKIFLFALLTVVVGAGAGWADTIDVPADYSTIQAAITAATSGDVINVAAGTYREQLYIDKNLSLTGAGSTLTIIEAPDAVDRTTFGITTWTSSARSIDAVIGVVGATVDISGLKVDGRDTGPDNFYGIYFHEGNGSVTYCEVAGITYSASPGAQSVVSMSFSHGTNAGPYTVNVSNNVIPSFQKVGIYFGGPDMVFTVNNNDIAANPSPDIAGNGIQLSYGATGTTNGNVVSGVGYTGSGWAGTGILLFESGDVTMTGDTVTDSQSAVNYSDWRWIHAHAVPVNLTFIDLTLTDNEWSFGAQLSGNEADLNVIMTNCEITGSTADAVDIWGTDLDPWGGSYYTGWDNGDLTVTVDGLILDDTAFDGIWTADLSGNLTNTVHGFSIRNSSFTSTVGNAVANNFTATIDAAENYWDDPDGPVSGLKAGGSRSSSPLISPAGFDLPEKVASFPVPGSQGDKAAGKVTGPIIITPWYGLPLGSVPMVVGTSGSIQSAVDLANSYDTVAVSAGTYVEAVLIEKPLTLLGATAGVNKNGYTVPTDYLWDDTVESIIKHPGGGYVALVDIHDTDDVTFDGFVVEELGAVGNTNTSLVRVYAHTQEITNINVVNNVIGPNTNVVSQDGKQGRMGLYIVNHPYGDDGVVNSTFAGNKIFDCQGNGDNIFLWTSYYAYGAPGPADMTGTVIEDNEIYGSHRAGIETAGGFANLTIRNNTIYGQTGLPADDPDFLKYGHGIQLIRGSSDKVSDPLTAYGPVNLTIEGNEIYGNQKCGIYMGPKNQDIVITDNVIRDNGWDGVMLDLEGNYWNPQFESPPVSGAYACFDCSDNVSATGNEIYGNGTIGHSLAHHGVQLVGIPTNAFQIDAENNWWGAATGPFDGSDDTGTGGLYNPGGTGDEVTDLVLYDPWAGTADGTIVPVTTGPLNCTQTVTLTFKYTADEHTPDMFGYNAVVSATPGLIFGAVADLEPFGDINNNFYAMSSGANQWTITGSTVGNPTYPVTGPVTGTATTGLFTIVFSATGSVVGDVVFDSLTLRDPNNAPIPVDLTGASITFDCDPPAAVTGITAAPAHNKVNVSWTHDLADVDHFEVYHGLWYDNTIGVSAYPEYDDQPGETVPTRPTAYGVFPTPAEWVPRDGGLVTTTTFADDATFASGRGVYYYEVFAVDAAGNGSPPAAANDHATNYWLGDVYGPSANPVPNGLVNVFDIDVLGNYFGTSIALDGAGNHTDVGPTDDWSRVGIPLTDSKIDFEDLMVFSMNFGVVGPAKTGPTISSVVDLAWVRYDDGRQALRLVEGTGVKGLNVRTNARVTGVTAGDLLDAQSELTFLKNVGANLDVSVAVTGVNVGFVGSGDLFIIDAESAIDPKDLTIKLRGHDNSNLKFRMGEATGTLTPRVFSLNPNYPNPFNPMTKISFSLPEGQMVKLAVYGIDGRKVATLLNEVRGPGLHEVVWKGLDDTGRQAASGMYFYRIDAGPYSQVHKMTLMK